MKHIIVFAALFLLFNNTSTGQDTSNFSQKGKIIGVWLEAQKDFERMPGITAAIIKDQNVVWSGAYGYANPEKKLPMQTNTIFGIASISKLFTSVAIMKLYDQGKLRLDDNVADILPWYKINETFPESAPVTIRTMLTHSSGLPRESMFPYWNGPDFPFPTDEQLKEKLKTQETLYPVATYFQYSNLAMALLGFVVEEVSGMDYEEYIEKEILSPLKLENTSPSLPEALHGKQLAQGYSAFNRAGERTILPLYDAKALTPAAGFSSTVLDLGKFAAWQFRLLENKNTEILKYSTLQSMHNVQWAENGGKPSWGLGFSIIQNDPGEKLVGHGGSCPGYRSQITLDPKNKMGYVVMINAGGTSPQKYIKGIQELVNKLDGFKKSESSARGEDYAGYYSVQPWDGEVYITGWKGGIVSINLPAETPGSGVTFYEHIEGDRFKRRMDNGDLGETFTFERDQKGKVTRVLSHGYYLMKIED